MNGNTLWADAISKKLDNVRVAIENIPDEKSAPIGHQFLWCHFILDIKMNNFRQIARLVAEGHMTKTQPTIFPSITFRERV